MRNQIVILAGGQGKRMNSGNVPKVLVMLKNKPLILYVLEEIEKINQLVKPVIVIGYKYREVKEVLGDGYIYALQTDQLGTANAVKMALGKVSGANILVLNGDHPFITAGSLKKLMKLHHEKQSNISIITSAVENFQNQNEIYHNFGRIIRRDNQISKIVEYKDATAAQKDIKEINPNIYMFNTAWLKENISKIKNHNAQGEYYLTDIVAIAVAGGQSIESLSIDPKEVIGINSKEDLAIAESFLAS